MKDQEEFEDYLVDKAKELLNEEIETPEDTETGKPEMPKKRNDLDEKAEKEATSKIPFSWDPREVEHLTNNRKKMSNDELEEFLKKNSDFQEELSKTDEWKGFSRWEERFMVQSHTQKDPEAIAEELEREERHVRLKMRMMGLKVDIHEQD